MSLWTFDLSGDHLVLDFTNTLGNRVEGPPEERLADPARLADFAEQTGLLASDALGRWRTWAGDHPEDAEALLAEARTLREALYSLFLAVAEKRPLAAADLAVLNSWWSRQVLSTDLRWVCCEGEQAPEAILAPIVREAVALLTSDRLDRVRLCDADTCGWLFLDRSRNRSRRWCDMKQCGNREKARRYYHRHAD